MFAAPRYDAVSKRPVRKLDGTALSGKAQGQFEVGIAGQQCHDAVRASVRRRCSLFSAPAVPVPVCCSPSPRIGEWSRHGGGERDGAQPDCPWQDCGTICAICALAHGATAGQVR